MREGGRGGSPKGSVQTGTHIADGMLGTVLFALTKLSMHHARPNFRIFEV